MAKHGYGDKFSDTPENSRAIGGFGTAGNQLDSVSRISSAQAADAQRGLTHLAAVCGWTVDESREVWQMLGLDRRVA